MLLFHFYDYDDFKYLFGIEHHGNGAKSRKNKILLQHLKNRALIKYCRERNDWSLLHIRSMADLKKLVLQAIQDSGKEDETLSNKVSLIGRTYWSAKYRTDEHQGLCLDYDKKSVRYINVERNRDFKMRAGKFMTALIKETKLGQILSEQVIVWLSEEFVADWETYTFGQTPEVTLHVDDDFHKIYSEHFCRNFNGCSCMVGRERSGFYRDSVEAKAAYITDKEGYVLARAIIFTNAIDQDGKVWRLLERQYSKESNEVLKRTLIDLLIKGGHIDAYKQVGCTCSDSRAYVNAADGSSLADSKFSIKCELSTEDVLSYQDSFKWYDIDKGRAYNHPDCHWNYMLDTTDNNLEGDTDDDDEYDSYDDFHDYGCNETVEAYYHGQSYRVDVDNLNEFIEIDDVWYHQDDVAVCAGCGKNIVKADHDYNDECEEYFCDDDCEQTFKEHNWAFSEFDNEYYKNHEDVKIVNVWDTTLGSYREMSICTDSRDNLINNGSVFGRGNLWFMTSETLLRAIA